METRHDTRAAITVTEEHVNAFLEDVNELRRTYSIDQCYLIVRLREGDTVSYTTSGLGFDSENAGSSLHMTAFAHGREQALHAAYLRHLSADAAQAAADELREQAYGTQRQDQD